MNAEMPIEPVRTKAVWGSRIALAGAVLLSLVLSSCSEAIRTGQSPSYLILLSLTGGASGTAIVQSDVISDTGSVFQDSGLATIQVALKDPVASAPSTVNSITITQYHVEYTRADGHSMQGVDVPFAFDGGVTVTIPAGGTGSVPFTLVRIQAKLEA